MRSKRRALRILSRVSKGKRGKKSKAFILFLSKKMVLVLVVKKKINWIMAASEDKTEQMVDCRVGFRKVGLYR